jgi:hypothetical protein
MPDELTTGLEDTEEPDTLLKTALLEGETTGTPLDPGVRLEKELETLFEEAGEATGIEIGTSEELRGTELEGMLEGMWLEDTWLDDGVPEPESPQNVMRRLA